MIIPDLVRRLIRRARPVDAQLTDPRPVDVWHDRLFDGDAEACAYFKRNPGRWS